MAVLKHSQRTTRTLTLTLLKIYAQITLLWVSRQILEIDEVTTAISLSTGRSPTTKNTTPLNLRIFTLMKSRIQNLKCYWDSYNHQTTDSFTSHNSIFHVAQFQSCNFWAQSHDPNEASWVGAYTQYWWMMWLSARTAHAASAKILWQFSELLLFCISKHLQ